MKELKFKDFKLNSDVNTDTMNSLNKGPTTHIRVPVYTAMRRNTSDAIH